MWGLCHCSLVANSYLVVECDAMFGKNEAIFLGYCDHVSVRYSKQLCFSHFDWRDHSRVWNQKTYPVKNERAIHHQQQRQQNI